MRRIRVDTQIPMTVEQLAASYEKLLEVFREQEIRTSKTSKTGAEKFDADPAIVRPGAAIDRTSG